MECANPIFIHSPPRSGSTWLQMVFQSHPSCATFYQPFFSYSFKGRLEKAIKSRSKNDFVRLLHDISHTDDDFICMKASYHTEGGTTFPSGSKDTITHQVFKQTHYHNYMEDILNLCPKAILICLIRNPSATVNSVLNNRRECPFDAEDDEWLTGYTKNNGKVENYFGYRKWKEFVEMAQHLERKYPKRVMLLSYEEIFLSRTHKHLKHLFSFVGLSYPIEVKSFVDASVTIHEESPTAVMKRPEVVTKWKESLSEDIQYAISKDLEGDSKDMYLQGFTVSDLCTIHHFHINFPDVYFLPSYGAITQTKTKTWKCAHTMCGSIIYVFLLCEDGSIETPYGYSGIWASNLASFPQIKRFRKWVLAFMNPIHESIRFNPYLENNFKYLDKIFLRKTYGIALTTSYEDFSNSMSAKHRSTVRRAIRENLRWKIEKPGKHSMELFQEMYLKTMHKKDASDFYLFDDTYFKKLELLDETYLVKVCDKEERTSHMAIFFLYRNYLHYHLSCSDKSLPYSFGFNFMFDRLASWALDKGVTLIHLGGGREENDSLANAKRRISNCSFAYETFYSHKSLSM